MSGALHKCCNTLCMTESDIKRLAMRIWIENSYKYQLEAENESNQKYLEDSRHKIVCGLTTKN